MAIVGMPAPVSTSVYSGNETIIVERLRTHRLGIAAICGILANIDAESEFNPKIVQSTNIKDSEQYTKNVDSGDYPNFYIDSKGYGLCQWTSSTRKQALLDYAKKQKTSIGDLLMQVDFIVQELKELKGKEGYSSMWEELGSIPDDSDGAFTAGFRFCEAYESPANSESSSIRGDTAKDIYWHYTSIAGTNTSLTTGEKIVEYAREIVGTAALWSKYPDSAALVYEVYYHEGVIIPSMSAESYYNKYKDEAEKVAVSRIAPGDLLFYSTSLRSTATNTGSLSTTVSEKLDIAIATGEGGRIYVNSSGRSVESRDIGSPTYILRILADPVVNLKPYNAIGEGSTGDSGGSSSPSISAEEYNLSAQYDAYNLIVSGALARIADEGYEYGYLIDMDHGGEFKFYVPEFTESAGANWNPIDLPGRSVQVFAYGSTNSRVVNISLELYAGEGVYKATDSSEAELMVEKMHRDLDFVKSLEYPDYSNVISRPPATVLLVLGASFNLEGVVSNVSVENMKPVDEYNRSMYAKLSFTVTQTAINPPDYRNIRAGYHSANAQDVSVDMWRIVDMPSQSTQPGIVTESANGAEIILPPTATIGGRGQIKKN